jgi:uncharacterized coiled-coil protein SlyX
MKNRILIAILPLLACFALLPAARAGVSPAPDGCYPNFTTAEGCNALAGLGTGAGNTGVGWYALFSDTTSSFNTGVGAGALTLNAGDSNTAVGAVALLLNNTGSNNTAVGTDALVNNTVDDNTATGFSALFANTIGGTLETSVLGFDLGPNTAVGSGALENNVDASANTAVGYNALHNQVTGDVPAGDPHLAANTSVGFEALANLGSAVGNNALNTALGYQALFGLTDGEGNVAIGDQAGLNLISGNENVAVGALAGVGLTSGTRNIFIGTTQGPATPDEDGHTYIGNINITSLPVGGNIDLVTMDLNSGLLGHNSSSRRYKEGIKPMDKASEGLYRLHPVSYRLKKEIDKHQSRAFGLIAEEVDEVNPDLIVRNAQGQAEGVHYEMVNTMLLNEFLKEHKKVEVQQATIAELKSTVAHQQKGMEVLTAQLKEQAAKIEKVNAELQANKPAPQVVTNKP